MNILIKQENDIRIFGFVNDEITDENVDFMKKYIETIPKEIKARFAVNLANVKKISKKFFEFLSSFKTMLCCLNAEILTYFMLTKTVNYVEVYISEGDLIENRRRILKRDFTLC